MSYDQEQRQGFTILNGFVWADKKWLNSRTKNFDKPMNIYEVNIGSWKMKRILRQKKTVNSIL